MTDKSSARIAVIADTSLQRHVLQQALAGGGYQVVLNSDPARLDEEALAACETDLWLVDLAQSEDSPLVDSLSVKRRGDVRKAKLYYLRDLSGKAARIKEKLS